MPLGALVVASQVGDALAPTLVDTHPLVLIALNARNRNLLLAVNQLDPLSYYVVGTLRLLASDPLFYLLGYWYGERAMRWATERSPSTGRWLRRFEPWFRRAAYPLVFIAPNNIICLFAGSAGMRPAAFVALNVTGTVARLALIAVVGDIFAAPIDDLLGVIARYRWWLTGLTVALVAASSWWQSRTGETELEHVLHLDDELADPDPVPEEDQP